MRSMADNQVLDVSVSLAAHTATANGAGVKRGGEGEHRTLLVPLGTFTDGTHTITVEVSKDGATWTQLGTAADAGAFDDPDGVLDDTTKNAIVIADNSRADTVLQVGILSIATYLRAVKTVAGATIGAVYTAIFQTSGLRYAGQKNPMMPGGIAPGGSS